MTYIIENLIDNFLIDNNSFVFESVEKGKIRGRYTIFGKNPDNFGNFLNVPFLSLQVNPDIRKYVSNGNQILIDGAHNPLAAKAVLSYLKSLSSGKKIIMLLGMMSNKDHEDFIKKFKNKVHSIITLDIPNQVNFMNKEKLSKIAQSCGIPSKTENSIESALNNIAKENNEAIIFCTGSLYFCGEILNLN